LRLDQILHLHRFNDAQDLSVLHGLPSFDADRNNGSWHRGHDHLACVELDWDLHEVLVLVLVRVVYSCVDLVSSKVEVEVEVIFLAHQLNFGALTVGLEID
jgi:hypothetical protein